MFGKTAAAKHLSDLCKKDHKLSKKVSSHFSDYCAALNKLTVIRDDKLYKDIVDCLYKECKLDIPEKEKFLLENIKAAKKRTELLKRSLNSMAE